MHINVGELKLGSVFEQHQALYLVLQRVHSKQARSRAVVRLTVKNLLTGEIIKLTFTSHARVKTLVVQKKTVKFLYATNKELIFLNEDDYEQIALSLSKYPQSRYFLVPESQVTLLMIETKVLDLLLPDKVILTVTDSPLAVKGNTAQTALKKVKTNTGLIVKTPLFIKTGDSIMVNTNTGDYVARK